jgi:hypothetical protein
MQAALYGTFVLLQLQLLVAPAVVQAVDDSATSVMLLTAAATCA